MRQCIERVAYNCLISYHSARKDLFLTLPYTDFLRSGGYIQKEEV